MTLTSYVAAAFQVLPAASRRRLVVVVALLAAISLMDLVAVILVLGLTALGAQQAGAKSVQGVPRWVEEPLDSVGADSVTTVVSALGLAVVALFVGKSVFATLILRRVLKYL